KNWESFKEYIEAFCAEKSINTMKRYNNESWYEYICRLRDWSVIRKYDENDIFRKLRQERMPPVIETICYSSYEKLDKLLERIYDYEKKQNMSKYINDDELRKNFIRNGKKNYEIKACFLCKEHGHLAKNCRKGNIKCYKCGKQGHYSNKCKEKIVGNNVEIIQNDIDERKIIIQKNNFNAVFDMGPLKA
ncbi:hypothetical protein H312_02717, partial [Anncaliia algerae PRA339]